MVSNVADVVDDGAVECCRMLSIGTDAVDMLSRVADTLDMLSYMLLQFEVSAPFARLHGLITCAFVHCSITGCPAS